MRNLKPLGSMVFGQITFNEEKLRSVLNKSYDPEAMKRWIDKTLEEVSVKHNQGYYLIFIRMNPKRTKLFLRIDTEKYRDNKGNIVIPNLFGLLGY